MLNARIFSTRTGSFAVPQPLHEGKWKLWNEVKCGAGGASLLPRRLDRVRNSIWAIWVVSRASHWSGKLQHVFLLQQCRVELKFTFLPWFTVVLAGAKFFFLATAAVPQQCRGNVEFEFSNSDSRSLLGCVWSRLGFYLLTVSVVPWWTSLSVWWVLVCRNEFTKNGWQSRVWTGCSSAAKAERSFVESNSFT